MQVASAGLSRRLGHICNCDWMPPKNNTGLFFIILGHGPSSSIEFCFGHHCALPWRVGLGDLGYLVHVPTRGFLCLLGSRMFLNLKKAGDSVVNEGSNIQKNNEGPVSTISDPQFAGPAIISSALGKLRFDFRKNHSLRLLI